MSEPSKEALATARKWLDYSLDYGQFPISDTRLAGLLDRWAAKARLEAYTAIRKATINYGREPFLPRQKWQEELEKAIATLERQAGGAG